MKSRSESDIQREIFVYLKFKGIFCWRNNSGVFKVGGRFIRCGILGGSDIVGILPDGRFLAIEVKKPGGKLSTKQEEFLEQIRLSRGKVIIAESLENVSQQV